jgi:hypothetical protein
MVLEFGFKWVKHGIFLEFVDSRIYQTMDEDRRSFEKILTIERSIQGPKD